LLADLSLDQETRLQEQDSRTIVAWLSPLNFCMKQNEYFSRRQLGTGEWFLETPKFKAWMNGETSVLWCPGMRIAMFNELILISHQRVQAKLS